MRQWFAAYTQPRAEQTALAHLQRQGFCAYLPRYLKRRRHARRTDWVASPLFPRYLFVELDLEGGPWRAVRSTVGISSLVCQGERPVPVPPRVVEEIRAREDERGLVRMGWGGGLRKGQPVRIESGIFADLVGLFECATDDERVVVLLNLLGRQVRASVSLDVIGDLA